MNTDADFKDTNETIKTSGPILGNQYKLKCTLTLSSGRTVKYVE